MLLGAIIWPKISRSCCKVHGMSLLGVTQQPNFIICSALHTVAEKIKNSVERQCLTASWRRKSLSPFHSSRFGWRKLTFLLRCSCFNKNLELLPLIGSPPPSPHTAAESRSRKWRSVFLSPLFLAPFALVTCEQFPRFASRLYFFARGTCFVPHLAPSLDLKTESKDWGTLRI